MLATLLSMRQATQAKKLLSQLSAGELYQWQGLKQYSHSMSRDVKQLLSQGYLKKVGPGLYLFPQKGRFGEVPADDITLVRTFLKTHDFLLFSTNLYNSLGLGLTQLKNETVVYNKKRYEVIELSGRPFYFKRPNNGYPAKLTPEFLLVDLVNNLKFVGESTHSLKQTIMQSLKSGKFDSVLVLKTANKYGKVGTKKFFIRFKK
jgi:hypothetical protein